MAFAAHRWSSREISRGVAPIGFTSPYNYGPAIRLILLHDMRVAISYALGFPDRIVSGAPRLGLLTEPCALDFRPLNAGEFPCFDLCMQAQRAGEAAIITLNAANEVAVQAFLNSQCSYLAIPRIVEACLSQTPAENISTVDDILRVDSQARRFAQRSLLSEEPTLYV